MSKQLSALIFDFDGLILDTETARYYAWKEAMESHGVELPLSFWRQNAGLPSEAFDPVEYLERRAKLPIDKASVRKRKQEIFESRMKNESLRPGIREYLNEARKRAIKLAICSSSPRKWVVPNLARFGIEDVFDMIITGTEVPQLKPLPDLYLRTLEVLALPPENCIAFEDSPKGIESAKAARIFCVAVPNRLTQGLDMTEADLVINSLAVISLGELEKRFLETPGE